MFFVFLQSVEIGVKRGSLRSTNRRKTKNKALTPLLCRDFGDGSDGWSFLSRDNFKVMLGECRDAIPASELGDHSYFAHLIVDGIDELYAEIAARGADILSKPADKPWGLREFGVRTPDGHRMTFGQPISR